MKCGLNGPRLGYHMPLGPEILAGLEAEWAISGQGGVQGGKPPWVGKKDRPGCLVKKKYGLGLALLLIRLVPPTLSTFPCNSKLGSAHQHN